MVRLILAASIAFASLIPLIAALVPAQPTARPFGGRGVLTKDDLDKLTYSAPVIDADALRQDPAIKSVAVALHLPKLHVRVGEPIPAYFVVRNLSDKDLGLDMRLDLFTAPPGKRNSCSIRLVNRSTGDEVRFIDKQVWACGGGSHVTVPESGYYVAAGDLSRGASGPLPAGEYECVWNYSFAKSNAVRFSVTGERAKNPPEEAAFPDVRFLELTEHDGRELKQQLERIERSRRVVWRKPGFDSLPAGGFAAALGVGVEGKYYSDVRRLPESDQLLQITAEWKFTATGDRLTVHLRPTQLGASVIVPDEPHLYLQVEGEAGDDRAELESQKLKEAMDKLRVGPGAPFAVDVRLPKDWRQRAGVTGKGRVAVLVSSTKIEPQSGWAQLQKEKELRREHDHDPPTWAGLLRTPFTELDFPKPTK